MNQPQFMIREAFFLGLCLPMVTLLYFSCKSSQESVQRKEWRDLYVEQFRLTYFRQLLLKSYNQSPAVKEIISGDHSGFTEPVLSEDDYRLIDSMTTAANAYLVKDSIEGVRRAEGAKGKRPLGFIVQQMNSNWLDSLAKKRLSIIRMQ